MASIARTEKFERRKVAAMPRKASENRFGTLIRRIVNICEAPEWWTNMNSVNLIKLWKSPQKRVTRSPRIVSHAHARALACVIDDFGLKCSDVSCPQRHLRLMKRKLQDFFMRISFHSPPHALSLFLTTTHPRKRKKIRTWKEAKFARQSAHGWGPRRSPPLHSFLSSHFFHLFTISFLKKWSFLVEKRRRTREEKKADEVVWVQKNEWVKATQWKSRRERARRKIINNFYGTIFPFFLPTVKGKKNSAFRPDNILRSSPDGQFSRPDLFIVLLSFFPPTELLGSHSNSLSLSHASPPTQLKWIFYYSGPLRSRNTLITCRHHRRHQLPFSSDIQK